MEPSIKMPFQSTLCDRLFTAYCDALDNHPNQKAIENRRKTIDHFELGDLGVIRLCWNDGYPPSLRRIPLNTIRQLTNSKTSETDVNRMIKNVATNLASSPSGSVGTHKISPISLERLCHSCVPSEVWGNTRDLMLDHFGIHDFYWDLKKGDIEKEFVTIHYYSKLKPSEFNQEWRLNELGKYIDSLTEDTNRGIELVIRLIQLGLFPKEKTDDRTKISNEAWLRAGRRDFVEACRHSLKNLIFPQSFLIKELMRAEKATEEGYELFEKVLSDNRTDEDIKNWVNYWKKHQ